MGMIWVFRQFPSSQFTSQFCEVTRSLIKVQTRSTVLHSASTDINVCADHGISATVKTKKEAKIFGTMKNSYKSFIILF